MFGFIKMNNTKKAKTKTKNNVVNRFKTKNI